MKHILIKLFFFIALLFNSGCSKDEGNDLEKAPYFTAMFMCSYPLEPIKNGQNIQFAIEYLEDISINIEKIESVELYFNGILIDSLKSDFSEPNFWEIEYIPEGFIPAVYQFSFHIGFRVKNQAEKYYYDITNSVTIIR